MSDLVNGSEYETTDDEAAEADTTVTTIKGRGVLGAGRMMTPASSQDTDAPPTVRAPAARTTLAPLVSRLPTPTPSQTLPPTPPVRKTRPRPDTPPRDVVAEFDVPLRSGASPNPRERKTPRLSSSRKGTPAKTRLSVPASSKATALARLAPSTAGSSSAPKPPASTTRTNAAASSSRPSLPARIAPGTAPVRRSKPAKTPAAKRRASTGTSLTTAKTPSLKVSTARFRRSLTPEARKALRGVAVGFLEAEVDISPGDDPLLLHGLEPPLTRTSGSLPKGKVRADTDHFAPRGLGEIDELELPTMTVPDGLGDDDDDDVGHDTFVHVARRQKDRAELPTMPEESETGDPIEDDEVGEDDADADTTLDNPLFADSPRPTRLRVAHAPTLPSAARVESAPAQPSPSPSPQKRVDLTPALFDDAFETPFDPEAGAYERALDGFGSDDDEPVFGAPWAPSSEPKPITIKEDAEDLAQLASSPVPVGTDARVDLHSASPAYGRTGPSPSPGVTEAGTGMVEEDQTVEDASVDEFADADITADNAMFNQDEDDDAVDDIGLAENFAPDVTAEMPDRSVEAEESVKRVDFDESVEADITIENAAFNDTVQLVKDVDSAAEVGAEVEQAVPIDVHDPVAPSVLFSTAGAVPEHNTPGSTALSPPTSGSSPRPALQAPPTPESPIRHALPALSPACTSRLATQNVPLAPLAAQRGAPAPFAELVKSVVFEEATLAAPASPLRSSPLAASQVGLSSPLRNSLRQSRGPFVLLTPTPPEITEATGPAARAPIPLAEDAADELSGSPTAAGTEASPRVASVATLASAASEAEAAYISPPDPALFSEPNDAHSDDLDEGDKTADAETSAWITSSDLDAQVGSTQDVEGTSEDEADDVDYEQRLDTIVAGADIADHAVETATETDEVHERAAVADASDESLHVGDATGDAEGGEPSDEDEEDGSQADRTADAIADDWKASDDEDAAGDEPDAAVDSVYFSDKHDVGALQGDIGEQQAHVEAGAQNQDTAVVAPAAENASVDPKLDEASEHDEAPERNDEEDHTSDMSGSAASEDGERVANEQRFGEQPDAAVNNEHNEQDEQRRAAEHVILRLIDMGVVKIEPDGTETIVSVADDPAAGAPEAGAEAEEQLADVTPATPACPTRTHAATQAIYPALPPAPATPSTTPARPPPPAAALSTPAHAHAHAHAHAVVSTTPDVPPPAHFAPRAHATASEPAEADEDEAHHELNADESDASDVDDDDSAESDVASEPAGKPAHIAPSARAHASPRPRSLHDELADATADRTAAAADCDDDDDSDGADDSFRSVVEVSSLDPRAAARAAAILKLNHAYIEHGVLPDSASSVSHSHSHSQSRRRSRSRTPRVQSRHFETIEAARRLNKDELLYEAELEIVDARRSVTPGPGPVADLAVPAFAFGHDSAYASHRRRSLSVSQFSVATEASVPPFPGGWARTPRAKRKRDDAAAAHAYSPRAVMHTRARSLASTSTWATKSAPAPAPAPARGNRSWGVAEWKRLESTLRAERAAHSAAAAKQSWGWCRPAWDARRVVDAFLAAERARPAGEWSPDVVLLRVLALERRLGTGTGARNDEGGKLAKKARTDGHTHEHDRERDTETEAPSTIKRVMSWVWGKSEAATPTQTPATSLLGKLRRAGGQGDTRVQVDGTSERVEGNDHDDEEQDAEVSDADTAAPVRRHPVVPPAPTIKSARTVVTDISFSGSVSGSTGSRGRRTPVPVLYSSTSFAYPAPSGSSSAFPSAASSSSLGSSYRPSPLAPSHAHAHAHAPAQPIAIPPRPASVKDMVRSFESGGAVARSLEGQRRSLERSQLEGLGRVRLSGFVARPSERE
ncbi:hypothetical protein Q5752_006029 [Cryptotrichosporon argae]